MRATLDESTAVKLHQRPFTAAMAPPHRPPKRPDPALLHGLLLPGALLWALLLRFGLGFNLTGVALLAGPLLVVYVLAPTWVKRSLARYDQDETKFLAGRDFEGLRTRFQRTWLLRRLAPPALISERRGRLAAAQELHEDARAAYRAAEGGYEGQPPLSVILGAAHASYEIGDWPAAIHRYRRLIKAGATFPTVTERLAHAEERLTKDPGANIGSDDEPDGAA